MVWTMQMSFMFWYIFKVLFVVTDALWTTSLRADASQGPHRWLASLQSQVEVLVCRREIVEWLIKDKFTILETIILR